MVITIFIATDNPLCLLKCIDRVQDMTFLNMALWQTEYFKLMEFERQQASPTFPCLSISKQDIRP
jgi:hypothetical protein